VSDYKYKYAGVKKCLVCKLDPQEVYKIEAIKFLELHHITSLNSRKSLTNSITSEKDVVLLCPNCHTAIHKSMSLKRIDKIEIDDFIKTLSI
jgi:predicted HNH restriction endonuclease